VPIIFLVLLQSLFLHVLNAYLPGYYIQGVRTFILHVGVTTGLSLFTGVGYGEIQRRFFKVMGVEVTKYEAAIKAD